MRLLHTADWHVGKTLKGLSRHDEHAAVLGEIVEVAHREAVDVVLVAGDLFESAAPSPDAIQLVWETLLALRANGAEVVAIAGNHDHARLFDAFRPLHAAAGITLLGRCIRPDAGGVVTVERGGERMQLALLPFLSQRAAVKTTDLFEQDAASAAGQYRERVEQIVAALTAGFAPDTVNVVLGHCHVVGGLLGGGERDAQTIFEYALSPQAFPMAAHYVALGHLHRRQQVPGPAPIWYPGAPIAVDFGDDDEAKGVLVVDVHPGRPAEVRDVPLRSPARLRTVTGTMEELRGLAGTVGDEWLRIFVREPARVGLADDVRELFPRAVDVRIDRPDVESERGTEPTRRGRSPHDLFADFLREQGVADERLERLFATLLDEVTSEPSEAGVGAG